MESDFLTHLRRKRIIKEIPSRIEWDISEYMPVEKDGYIRIGSYQINDKEVMEVWKKIDGK